MADLPEEETRLREQHAKLDLALGLMRAEAKWQAAQPARRDRIATAALAGMLANPSTPAPSTAHHATWAVAYADALIAELDKEVQP